MFAVLILPLVGLAVVIGLLMMEIAFVLWFPRRPPVTGHEFAEFRVGLVRGPIVWSWGVGTLRVKPSFIEVRSLFGAISERLTPRDVVAVKVTKPFRLARVAFVPPGGSPARLTATMYPGQIQHLRNECERLGWHVDGWEH